MAQDLPIPDLEGRKDCKLDDLGHTTCDDENHTCEVLSDDRQETLNFHSHIQAEDFTDYTDEDYSYAVNLYPFLCDSDNEDDFVFSDSTLEFDRDFALAQPVSIQGTTMSYNHSNDSQVDTRQQQGSDLDHGNSEGSDSTSGIDYSHIYEDAANQRSCPIDCDRMEAYLDGYDETKKQNLLYALRHGFRLHSDMKVDDMHSSKYNHPSASELSEVVTRKLSEELKANRIAGPFPERPPDLVVSPIAAIPKKCPGKYRIIHDLTFPKGSPSVNRETPREFAYVEYETVDDCARIVASLGHQSQISKADIASAFRILPVHKDDFHLLGFYWEDMGGFFFDKMCAMGASCSCAHFEQLSKAIQWILIHKFNVKFISHIIDDFMLFSPRGSSECYYALQSFLALAESLGIPVNHDKTIEPTTRAELHGILFDTNTMEMSLPPEKICKALELIDEMCSLKKVTIAQIQSIVGYLNFCCKIIPSGRPFLRRLIDMTKGSQPKWFKVRMTRSVRSDLHVWRDFLQEFNGKVLIDQQIWSHSTPLEVFSDASKFAYSGIFGREWFYGCIPTSWMHLNIAIKEFIPVYLAMRLWQNEFSHRQILFRIDNESVVYNIKGQTSKLPQIMNMMRPLVLTAMKQEIRFTASHIRGKLNITADLISRLQITRALAHAPHLHQQPRPVPREWLPWRTLPQSWSEHL